MTIELTVEEKISIIDNHLRSIAYKKYNLDLTLLEENTKPTPDLSIINRANSDIELLNDQITALEAEKNSLN